jgi:hypothetical protein
MRQGERDQNAVWRVSEWLAATLEISGTAANSGGRASSLPQRFLREKRISVPESKGLFAMAVGVAQVGESAAKN